MTGAAGFIGGHLATRFLSQDIEVHLLDNFSRGVEDPFLKEIQNKSNARFFTIDLMQPSCFKDLGNDYDIIIHLAAIIGVRHVMQRPYSVLHDNVSMLGKVIEFCHKQKKLKRLLFASTSEVTVGSLQYLDLKIPTPETEALALTQLDAPRTSYMLSKIYGEAMCHHSGIPFTVFRPHNVYGPRMGMSHVVPELLQRTLNESQNGKLEVASPTHRRAFCYIDDAIEQISRMVTTDQALNQVLNLGNQEAECSIEELANMVLKVVNRNDIQIKALPDTPGSPSRRCPDMTCTNKIINYKAQVDLYTGVEKTFDWYNEHVFTDGGKTAV
jgi:UDP-glucose 4-epimerase